MKASELVSAISELVAKHGDREIVFDCDSILTEIAKVELLKGPYPDLPVFVISPDSSSEQGD